MPMTISKASSIHKPDGRKKQSAKSRLLTGNWRLKAELKKAKAFVVPVVERVPLELTGDDLAGICRTGIPGYDPWKTGDGCEFNAEAAFKAINFFHQSLCHIKGEHAGKAFVLERWQMAFVGNLFGWMRDGIRRYREALGYVPRKNGKTALCAGLLLYVLFEDDEPGAEVYGAASTYSQACHVFEHASGMVWRNETLKESSKVLNGQAKSIMLEPRELASGYKVICSEAATAHGQNTHCAVIDELHTHATPELVDTLLTSTGARRQPLIIHITTADYDREGSVCNMKHDYACKVRDGIIDDPSFLPMIYEAGKDDDWTDHDVWRRVNPNLGISLTWEYMERECKRAIDSPPEENKFKRLHLNMRTEQDVRWLSMKKWDACDGILPDLDGQECFAGLDLAAISDIAAFVLFFPKCDNAVLPFFWCPENNARERQRTDRVPYMDWAKRGLIELTPGDVIDYGVIRKRINKLGERYDIREIAIDRWDSTQLQTQLGGDGFEIIKFGQGYASMKDPTMQLERLVISEKLLHGGQPVLRWMASNVAVQIDDAGNMKPSKKKSTEKIDGIVSLIMAIGRMLVAEEPKKSVYADRGVFTV